MELGERAEEALETLWVATQEGHEKGVPGNDLDDEGVDRLLEAGLADDSDGLVTLTEAGLP